MAPPTEKKILAALRAATLSIYEEDKANLTVKSVRNKVTAELDLSPAFFVEGEWKAKSKESIKSYAVCLVQNESFCN